MQSDVLATERRKMSPNNCTLRLAPSTTTNSDGWLAYLTPELVELVQAQKERIRCTEMLAGRALPHLFQNLEDRHRGQRITDFSKAWALACLEETLDLEVQTGARRARRKA
jgi:hypothetical protein